MDVLSFSGLGSSGGTGAHPDPTLHIPPVGGPQYCHSDTRAGTIVKLRQTSDSLFILTPH